MPDTDLIERAQSNRLFAEWCSDRRAVLMCKTQYIFVLVAYVSSYEVRFACARSIKIGVRFFFTPLESSSEAIAPGDDSRRL